jgi:hypothetical protein
MYCIVCSGGAAVACMAGTLSLYAVRHPLAMFIAIKSLQNPLKSRARTGQRVMRMMPCRRAFISLCRKRRPVLACPCPTLLGLCRPLPLRTTNWRTHQSQLGRIRKRSSCAKIDKRPCVSVNQPCDASPSLSRSGARGPQSLFNNQPSATSHRA